MAQAAHHCKLVSERQTPAVQLGCGCADAIEHNNDNFVDRTRLVNCAQPTHEAVISQWCKMQILY
jgi:hypothetical protein